MKNKLYRKGLIFGAVFILIIIISNTVIVTNAQLNEESLEIEEFQKNYFNEEKPDLEIIDAYGVTFWDGYGYIPYIEAIIQNKGNVPLKGHDIACEQTVKYPFSNQTLFQITNRRSKCPIKK